MSQHGSSGGGATARDPILAFGRRAGVVNPAEQLDIRRGVERRRAALRPRAVRASVGVGVADELGLDWVQPPRDSDHRRPREVAPEQL